MTDLERQILEHVLGFETVKRDLLRRFHRRDIHATYRSMIERGIISETGSGRPGDPKYVRAGQPPQESTVSKLPQFVTKIPIEVWNDFVYNCAIRGHDPAVVAIEMLNEARKLPNISQNEVESA